MVVKKTSDSEMVRAKPKRKYTKPRTRKVNQNQGRPSVITPQKVALLISAFQNGLTINQACRYSGISRDAYYNKMKKDADFSDKMIEAQERLNFKSKEVIAHAINSGDVQTAKWWQERKNKDEFSVRRETTGAGGGPIRLDNTPELIDEKELDDAIFGNN